MMFEFPTVTDGGGVDDSDSESGDGSGGRRRHPAVLGFQGGLFATCVLTVFRMPISRSLPPTANLWAKYVTGGDLSDHRMVAMLLHLLYGALGGSVFAMSFDAVDTHSPVGTEMDGLLFGVLASIPFSLFGTRVVLSRVLGMDMDADEVMIFHAGHLVYGIAIGAWIGSRLPESE